MTWHSTWQNGPGTVQHELDLLELGSRVAMRWYRCGCACDQDEAQRLRRMGAGQLALFGVRS